jgi:membrane-bound lytic murein transglycosylase MltF
MELMPATAELYLVRNRFSATDNLSGGIQYLADVMHRVAAPKYGRVITVRRR